MIRARQEPRPTRRRRRLLCQCPAASRRRDAGAPREYQLGKVKRGVEDPPLSRIPRISRFRVRELSDFGWNQRGVEPENGFRPRMDTDEH
jgi:hypothetical protein